MQKCKKSGVKTKVKNVFCILKQPDGLKIGWIIFCISDEGNKRFKDPSLAE
jgi:hypothetical protein